MIKDLIVSFRDNFKDKVKNPFLGTYALVWIIRNWDLIFTLFNFNRGTSLENKLKIITVYLEDNPFFGGLVINVLYTFLFLIIIYFLLNVSRAIVNLYEKKLKPWVYKLTDNSSIVLKDDYERLRNERDNLLVRINNERDEKSKIENELKRLEEQINERNLSEAIASPDYDENKEIESIYFKLEERNLIDDFKKVALEIKKNGQYVMNKESNELDLFIEHDLISNQGSTVYSNKYKLSKKGEKLYAFVKTIIND